MMQNVKERVLADIRKAANPRTPTGMKDHTGQDIHTGDLVRFGVTDGDVVPHGTAAQTTVTDVVLEMEGDFYAYNCEVNGGVFLRTVAPHCPCRWQRA